MWRFIFKYDLSTPKVLVPKGGRSALLACRFNLSGELSDEEHFEVRWQREYNDNQLSALLENTTKFRQTLPVFDGTSPQVCRDT